MIKRLVKLSLITSLAILLAMPTAGLATQNANVAGKWLLTISTPRGDSTITLNIEQDGSTLTGTSLREGQDNSSELTGTIDGNNITLNMRMGGGGGSGRGAIIVAASLVFCHSICRWGAVPSLGMAWSSTTCMSLTATVVSCRSCLRASVKLQR